LKQLKQKIKTYEHPLGWSNRNLIINTVVISKTPIGPRAITRNINNKKMQKNTDYILSIPVAGALSQEADFEKRYLSSSQYNPTLNNLITEKESRSKLTERTVLKWCSILTEEGIFDHKDNKYSISRKASKELRYFADMFGSQSLYYLTQFPLRTTDKTIQEFVTRFGALMIYAFIIAAKPFQDKTKDKDRIIMDWIQHAIPITKMFQYFFATFKTDTDDRYELDQKMIPELYRALEKLYPDIFTCLEKANWSQHL
jgi:hypothetical protein